MQALIINVEISSKSYLIRIQKLRQDLNVAVEVAVWQKTDDWINGQGACNFYTQLSKKFVRSSLELSNFTTAEPIH
jgi:hypothetical protein